MRMAAPTVAASRARLLAIVRTEDYADDGASPATPSGRRLDLAAATMHSERSLVGDRQPTDFPALSPLVLQHDISKETITRSFRTANLAVLRAPPPAFGKRATQVQYDCNHVGSWAYRNDTIVYSVVNGNGYYSSQRQNRSLSNCTG